MKAIQLKVTRIGNSRGVRLPAASLKRYRITDAVVMEERSDGILLRVPGRAVPKLSWEETASQMAVQAEDWTEWDGTLADGLDDLPWDPGAVRRVAEPKAPYKVSRRAGKR